jgi:glycosyltransferase involved in cell wall biosynthesis
MGSITVVLPVFNGMKYLERSVNSVLKQTITDFEFLVVDDCSTDGSWEYLGMLTDRRIKLFRNSTNKGLFYNLNFLIGQSDSPLIKLWSQDDVMYPYCLERVLAFHRLHPEIGFSYSTQKIIDEKDAVVPSAFKDETPDIVSTRLHTRIAFYTGSIAGNISNVTLCRKALDKTGLFNENMKISGDFEMWVRLAKDHPVGYIREPLLQLRNHEGQLSRQGKYYIYHLKEDIQAYDYLLNYSAAGQKREGRRLLRNHKLQFYYTLMLKEFIRGHIKTGWAFLKTLHSFDNIFLLSWYFLGNRIFFRKRNKELRTSNSSIIQL